MKNNIRLGVVLLLGISAAALLWAPKLGLGEKYEFILYRFIGLSRRQAMWWLIWLTGLFILVDNLSIARKWVTDFLYLRRQYISWRQFWRDVTTQQDYPLFWDKKERAGQNEQIGACICASFFALLFYILLSKNIHALRDLFDMHWHQAYLDYDINWKTPLFSLGGNLLNNFGMQVPFNTTLSPFLGVAHVIAPTHELVISVSLFFAAMALLFWSIGGTIHLRPIPRVILAGSVSLIATIPFGIDALVPFVPPYLFIPQATLTRGYWEEVTILSLAASHFFLCLGRGQSTPLNIALAFCFAALSYVVLLSFPGAALFSIQVIGLYCFAFLATSERSKELWWKVGVSIAVASSMLLLQFPTFFRNLYANSFGAYFSDLMLRMPTRWDLFRTSSVALIYSYDRRVPLILGISLLTACTLIVRSTGALRRIAIAVVSCEIWILILGAVNALIIQDPLSFNYAEQIHTPFLIFMFMLFVMFAATSLLIVVAKTVPVLLKRNGNITYPKGMWGLNYSRILLLLPLPIFLAIALTVPTWTWVNYEHSPYPPKQPASVKMLEQEIGLAPGGEFRGRLLVLLGERVKESGWDMSPLLTNILQVTEANYGRYLKNDHWVDLFAFNIPIINEYAHWTSPVGFVVLREFFGRREDVFQKALFVLRSFDPRIARMMGVKMILTDSPAVRDATLVYETIAGDSPLRIFQLNKANIGQYSPTRVVKVANASEAIAVMSQESFDPERDVVSEEELPNDLHPGKLMSVKTNLGPRLNVRAGSPGQSLLVLPFEYSECLRLEILGGRTARLIPVNLQQTGLLFEGQIDITISYRFGPWDRPECRGDDVKRADRLKLRNALSSGQSR